MNILSLDTSTDVLSIALKTENSYEERLINGNFSHSENLLGEIISLLKRAGLELKDLDLLIATKGPGSFTGLRVGIACGAKLVTIETLMAMAYGIKGLSPYPILACIDAKKKRFYYSLFSSDGDVILPVMDADPSEVISIAKEYEKIIITGKDAQLFLSKLESEELRDKFIIDEGSPRNIASALIKLGLMKFEEEGEDDIGDGPLYVRRSDAEEALIRKMEGEND